MKTKFIFCCAESFDLVPTSTFIQQELKCENIIDLSIPIHDLIEPATKTRFNKAGPLQRIYDAISGHHCHSFLNAWGLSIEKYHTQKLMNVFLVSDEADLTNLMWITLKDKFSYKLFCLDNDGIDPLTSLIYSYKYLNDDFPRLQSEFSRKKKVAMILVAKSLTNENTETHRVIEEAEDQFVQFCKNEASAYLNKFENAIKQGWT